MNEKQINELRKGLGKVIERLTEKRGLRNKCAGQEFLFRTEGINPITKFQILTKYRNKRKGTSICANIRINEEGGGLNVIVFMEKYAKPIHSYLHTFSHKYNISLGNLSNFNEYI